MPNEFDSGYNMRIGSWKILYDEKQILYIVYVEDKLVKVTSSMFDAYNTITDLIFGQILGL